RSTTTPGRASSGPPEEGPSGRPKNSAIFREVEREDGPVGETAIRCGTTRSRLSHWKADAQDQGSKLMNEPTRVGPADGGAAHDRLETRMRPGVEREYRGDGFVVTWEPPLCVHSGNCFRGLREVFRPWERPW